MRWDRRLCSSLACCLSPVLHLPSERSRGELGVSYEKPAGANTGAGNKALGEGDRLAKRTPVKIVDAFEAERKSGFFGVCFPPPLRNTFTEMTKPLSVAAFPSPSFLSFPFSSWLSHECITRARALTMAREDKFYSAFVYARRRAGYLCLFFRLLPFKTACSS